MNEHVGVLGLGVVDDRRQRFVVDLDELGRVLGERSGVGDDEHDRIAGEAHLAFGERRARCLGTRGADRRVPLRLHVRVQVCGGEHVMDAGLGECGGSVDAADRGAGEVAADEARVQHAWQRNVVDVGAGAGEQARVLDSVHARTHVPRRGRCGGLDHRPSPPAGAPAACRTAFTMPWYPVQRQRLPDNASRMS